MDLVSVIQGGKTAESRCYDLTSGLPSGDVSAVFERNLSTGFTAHLYGNKSYVYALIRPQPPYTKEMIKFGLRRMDVPGINVTSISDVCDMVSVEMKVNIPQFLDYLEKEESI